MKTQALKFSSPPASLASPVSASSTVVFEESFDGATGFPPSGWKTVNADGGGTTGPWFQGNASIFTAYSGTGYAAANYQGANDFYIDEWLISPRIFSIGSNDTLLFWHRSPDYSSWDDSLEVRLSVSDTAILSFTIKLNYFKTSTDGWMQKRIPLRNFVPAGSNIYIAFRYLIYNGGISGTSSDYVGLDLVQIVRTQVDNDVKTSSIDFPCSKSKIPLGQTIEPLATFQNVGGTVQSNIPVRVRITSPTATIYESAKIISSLAPGESYQQIFDAYAPGIAGQYTATVHSLLSGDQNTTNDSLTGNFTGALLLSGVFTVGVGGDIPTLKSAIDTLNHNIVAGEITFSLISSSYTEPPLSIDPIDYFFIQNVVKIQPAPGISPVITINATEAEPFGLAIDGASKVIIDGANSDQNNRNTLLMVSGSNGRIALLIRGTDEATADSNTVKNLSIQTGADSLSSSDGFYGILLYGNNSLFKDAGNIIYNCEVTKHGAIGIAAQWQTGVVLENNFIHDWTQMSGENDVHGIWLADGTIGAVVAGNTIGNIKTNVNYFWAYGIENSSGAGSNTRIYNNMIYDVLSSGAGGNINYSIGIFGSNISNSGDEYYYNSIYLSGTDYSTSSLSHTAGFEFVGGTDISVKNNIVINESIISGTSSDNKGYCVYLSTVPANFISNNNDFFAPNPQGVVGYNADNKTTLCDWQSSFSPQQDSMSVSADPLFISGAEGNLHITTNEVSPANAAASPVSWIVRDIDGDIRNTGVPDIGADEFTPGSFTINVTCETGWNLVSVPLIVSDYRKVSLFEHSISDAFSYRGNYVPESSLVNGVGYWLKYSGEQNIDMAGFSLLVDTVNVVEGWNIIGTISTPVAISSIEQLPPEIVTSSFFGFNSAYFEADTLQPGKGYWVKVKQDGKLILR